MNSESQTKVFGPLINKIGIIARVPLNSWQYLKDPGKTQLCYIYVNKMKDAHQGPEPSTGKWIHCWLSSAD